MIEGPENGHSLASPENEDEEEAKDRGRNITRIGSIVAHSSTEKEDRAKKQPEKEAEAKEAKPEATEPEKKDFFIKDTPEEKEERRAASEDAARVETEVAQVLREHLSEEKENLKAQAAELPAESPEKAQAEHALDLVEGVDQKLDNPEQEFDPAVEAEYQRRLAEINNDEAADSEPETTPEPQENVLQIEHGESETEQDPATDDTASASASASGTNPPPPPNSPPPGGTTGPEEEPANWQRRPSTRSSFTVGGGTANARPAASETTIADPPETQVQPERSNKAGAFLLGGIFGYVTGRRGGRKRAEAELRPKLAKLDQEVEKSKQLLQKREADLKRAAAEKQREQFLKKAAERRETNEGSQKRAPIREILKQTVETAPGIQRAPEKLPPVPIAEVKRTEQLSTPELLKRASELFISGTSVRQLYETNQIDRPGLIEIVQTALRGGNIKDAFEKVELGLERQRERAREFRHDPAAGSSTTAQTSDPLPEPLAPVLPPMPNLPDTTSLQPVGSTPAPATLQSTGADAEVEPINLSDARKQTALPAPPIIVITIIFALFVAWLLFR